MCVHLHVFVGMCRFFPILPVAVSQFIESQEAKVRIYANLAEGGSINLFLGERDPRP